MSCCANQTGDKRIKESVREYYGKRLKTNEDLKTNVCTQPCGKIPQHVKEALKMCHDAVVSKYYGCGLVFPEVLEGTHVLDLGSGSGRDCFVLSKMVGEKGHVTGVDMTQEQLDIANKYHDYHAEKFGYSKPNTEFLLGDIENLSEAGIKDDSVDVIVSNCVVNLTSSKKSVLQESSRVLKEGGEVYFSDIYADRHLSDDIRKHEVLWGECIAGALWWRELVDLCKDVGLSGPYLVDGYKTVIEKEELKKVLGDAAFVSATYRLFKFPRSDEDETLFEATYKGSIDGCPEEFKFDIYHTFETGKPQVISANMADIFRKSRYASHFDVKPSSCASEEPPRDAYAMADPFSGLGIDTNANEAPKSCCGSKPCFNAEGCKDMIFKDTLEGKALKNHVIKTKRATSDGHCESMCFLDDRCIAYSFGRDKDQQKNMCELSESDHVMHPDDLVDRPDTIYRRAENNCNCQRFQVCRVNFVDNTHVCECKAGFTGQRCEIEIKPCDSMPCLNGGTCTDNADSFNCTCAAGFTGKSCQTDINCEPSPCMNGGTCNGNAHGYTCQCPNEFLGKNCITGYYASSSGTTWDNAKLECEGKGANLPSIHSAEENAVVWQLYQKINSWMWIGLHDPNGDGNYVWSDGTPVDYKNWNPRQDNPNGTCVLMDDKQKWTKNPCSWSHKIGCLF